MSSPEESVKELLAPFAQRPIPVEEEAAAERRAERLLPALRQLVRSMPEALERRQQQQDQRRELRWRWQVGLAFAASVSLVAGLAGVLNWNRLMGIPDPSQALAQGGRLELRSLQGSVVRRHAGTETRATPGPGGQATLTLEAGDEISTPEGGHAELRAGDGLTVEAVSATRLALTGSVEAGSIDQLTLTEGRIFVQVPRLRPGHSFSVATPQARVVVHGTAFTVEVLPAGDGPQGPREGRTCVRVTSGVVGVLSSHREATLVAGETWGCEGSQELRPAASASANTPASASAASPSLPQPTRGTPTSAASHGPRPPQGAPNAGTLAEENRLLSVALAAEGSGDREAARAAASTLLERYPASPLAADARRLLGRLSGGR